jgi:hypothetical protein
VRQQFLKSREIADGEILREGVGVQYLLDEKLLQWFGHAKRVIEQENKGIRINI